MKTIIEQRYNSTYGFVQTNELEKEADKFFGKGWEAEDDVTQIQSLINHLGRTDLFVSHIEGLKEDDILVSNAMTTTISYDDTRDVAIRVIAKLIKDGHLDDNDDHYFDVQDTIQDEINKVLGLDIDDNFEIKIK